MCGRFYVDDETLTEIEKIVREIDRSRVKTTKKTIATYPWVHLPFPKVLILRHLR